MSTTIHVSQVLHKGAVMGKHSGRVLREGVVSALLFTTVGECWVDDDAREIKRVELTLIRYATAGAA